MTADVRSRVFDDFRSVYNSSVLPYTVPFRPDVQSYVTSDLDMNFPGISSGVTASSEQ
jgi:hypothetical protein